MSNNKPVKPQSIGDAIAGQPPATVTKPQSIKKTAPSPKVKEESPKTNSSYSQSVADRIETAAKKQAQADAAAIKRFAQQCYERELANEVQYLLGDDVENYFRFEIENLSLPSAATAGYLPTVEVTALPSSN